MGVILDFSHKTKGQWSSGIIKPRKRYLCDYCGKRRRIPYRWVDGLRSCVKCEDVA